MWMLVKNSYFSSKQAGAVEGSQLTSRALGGVYGSGVNQQCCFGQIIACDFVFVTNALKLHVS